MTDAEKLARYERALIALRDNPAIKPTKLVSHYGAIVFGLRLCAEWARLALSDEPMPDNVTDVHLWPMAETLETEP